MAAGWPHEVHYSPLSLGGLAPPPGLLTSLSHLRVATFFSTDSPKHPSMKSSSTEKSFILYPLYSLVLEVILL